MTWIGPMPKIFCCYRREDSTHQTGRIFDQLAIRFGKENIFRDLDSMPLGLDFRRVLSEQVAQCDVLLAMIGDAWLSAKEKTGERRLDNAGDFVRIEIESALARKIPVIPILVGHAPMPTADDLPEGLRELAFRNGQAVRADPDFHHDVERLVRGITDVVGVAPKPKVVSLMPKDAKSGSVADLENTRTFLQKNVLNPAGETGRGHKSGAVPKVTPVAAPVTPHRPSRSVSPKLEPTAEETRPVRPRRRLLWGAAVLVCLVLGLVVALLAIRPWDRSLIDPMRLIEVRREVDSIRRSPTELLSKSKPPLEEWEEALPAVDYSAFEILQDDRVVDLREWKPVPTEPVPTEGATEPLICPVTMVRRLLLCKKKEAKEIRFEFRTSGTELCVSSISPRTGVHVTGQRQKGVVGGRPMMVRQIAIDVRDRPEGRQFPVHLVATYWNSFQKEDDLWFGAIGYPNSSRVSLLIVFPKDKPFKDYWPMVAPTRQAKPEEFRGAKALFASENRDWVYWEINNPKEDNVYSIYWKW